MFRKFLCSKLLMLLCFFSSISVMYSQEPNISVEKLVNDSEFIIKGQVENISCKFDDNKNIWTYVNVKCKDIFKGEKRANVVIKIPGGEIGELGQAVSGVPNYSIGEEVLSFLGIDKNGDYYVNGWEKGKFSYKDGKWYQKDKTLSDQFLDTLQIIIEQKKN